MNEILRKNKKNYQWMQTLTKEKSDGKEVIYTVNMLSHKTLTSYMGQGVILQCGELWHRSPLTLIQGTLSNNRATCPHVPPAGVYREGTALFLGHSCQKCIT